jgi:hypothetical protein
MTISAFDHAVGGNPASLLRSDGGEMLLDVARWNASACLEDAWLLDRCSGALAGRGVPALGIDVSPAAEALCRRRGVPMLRVDLFTPLPGEGRWSHVLLIDGNIGIGGDPARLLRRAARLLKRGGSVLVETDPEQDALWLGSVQVVTAVGRGVPIPWAAVGTRALQRVSAGMGFRTGSVHHGDRCFVELLSA